MTVIPQGPVVGLHYREHQRSLWERASRRRRQRRYKSQVDDPMAQAQSAKAFLADSIKRGDSRCLR